MASARLLLRLIGAPLLRDWARTALTILAVALGVGVVVAIDVAGEAAAGSFRSSVETLQGSADFEIHQVGGLPEALFGELSRLPEPLRFSARMEGVAVAAGSGESLPLFGADLLGDPLLAAWSDLPSPPLDDLAGARLVWASAALGAEAGDQLTLVINDRSENFLVQGILKDAAVRGEALGSMVLTDIAAAQRVLDRQGVLDRIYVQVPEGSDRDWAALLRERLPAGAVLSEAGVRSRQTREMLGAFRWNIRVLSYIALIVGAFLIYNTVSVSVVRRRPQIGVVRALGASQRMVRWAFLAEGCMLGAAGAALGLPLGRLLALSAVEAMGRTVQSLYVSSDPGAVALGPGTVALALCAGIGVALASSWWPAREAASVVPAEAMAKARLDYLAAASTGTRAWQAIACAAAGAGLCLLPAWNRIPVAGYAGALALIAAAALLAPTVSEAGLRAAGRMFAAPLGPASTVASRSLSGSLSRTAVIVAALSTATAMMVSVGVMVGSFRETVDLWMGQQLRADLYVRPEGAGRPGQSPTMAEGVARAIESSPDVEAVDRFRRYPIQYGGLPATLGLGDVRVHRKHAEIRFLEGPEPSVIWDQLSSGASLIASEPFSRKHDVHLGDTVELPLGSGSVGFSIAGVYYDYAGEQGRLVGDRSALLRHLPDPRLSDAAVYLREGADAERSRGELVRALGGWRVQVVPNRQLRDRALVVFDRAFAITYALEAIAIVVAILGMASALLTLVIDRRAEFAVLRILGASKAQVRRIVLAQAGLLGLISSAMGAALGGALSLVLIKVINKQSFGWTIQFHWPVAFLCAALGSIFAASLVAGLHPARIAAGTDPTEALREE